MMRSLQSAQVRVCAPAQMRETFGIENAWLQGNVPILYVWTFVHPCICTIGEGFEPPEGAGNGRHKGFKIPRRESDLNSPLDTCNVTGYTFN